MADDVDITGDRMELEMAARIDAARSDIKPGTPGECYECGLWSERLILGACAPCRDEAMKYKLINGG